MAKKIEYVKPVGFSDEEKRLRRRILDMGIRQRDVCEALGLQRPDVSHVICGTSRSPRHVEAVYAYLGLEMPKDYGKQTTTGQAS